MEIKTKPKGGRQVPALKPKRRGTRKLVPFSARRKTNQKRKATTPELAVYAMLKAEGIKFSKEKSISRLHVDIFIEPRTVVEVLGCFWHKHDCLMPVSGWTPKDHEVRTKDANRFAFLRSQGYEIILIWECDLISNPDRIRALIRGWRVNK